MTDLDKVMDNKRMVGALILAGIFLFAALFLASHDYFLTVKHNDLVVEYNDLDEDCNPDPLRDLVVQNKNPHFNYNLSIGGGD